MNCLRKYNRVKLPREEIPKLKGKLGYWLHLAERAAFRKGIGTYCDYKNPVEPGIWSGGIVGLKKILGVRSREKSLQLLDELQEQGYLTYTLDEDTKLLTYRITDWVVGTVLMPARVIIRDRPALIQGYYTILMQREGLLPSSTVDGYKIICYPEQIDLVQEFFGGLADIATVTMDDVERVLEFDSPSLNE